MFQALGLFGAPYGPPFVARMVTFRRSTLISFIFIYVCLALDCVAHPLSCGWQLRIVFFCRLFYFILFFLFRPLFFFNIISLLILFLTLLVVAWCQVRAYVLHQGQPSVAGPEGQHKEAEVRAHHGPQDEHVHRAAVQGVSM